MLWPRKNIYKIHIPTIMVKIIILYCVLFPADKMNLKEIILLFTLFVCLPTFFFEIKRNRKLLTYGVLFPIVLSIYAIVCGVGVYATLSYGYVWFYLLLIPAIVKYNIDIKKTFIFATTVVALIINFIYLTDVCGLISIFDNPVVLFFNNMNELQYGKGALATFGYSIFYKSSPLLLLTYGYTLFNKKYVHAGILLLAFLASGTRANFLVAMALTVMVPMVANEKKEKKIVLFIIMTCVAICVMPYLVEKMAALNAIKFARSESIKIAAVEAIFRNMNEKPWSYIVGTGVGSSFYFPTRNAYVTVVEVSYFDYFRQVGIIGMLCFANFLLIPIKYYWKNGKWIIVSYVGYLAVAFTNPLLVNSTAFMLYIMIFSGAFDEKRKIII